MYKFNIMALIVLFICALPQTYARESKPKLATISVSAGESAEQIEAKINRIIIKNKHKPDRRTKALVKARARKAAASAKESGGSNKRGPTITITIKFSKPIEVSVSVGMVAPPNPGPAKPWNAAPRTIPKSMN